MESDDRIWSSQRGDEVDLPVEFEGDVLMISEETEKLKIGSHVGKD
jgi:hypothetical protein